MYKLAKKSLISQLDENDMSVAANFQLADQQGRCPYKYTIRSNSHTKRRRRTRNVRLVTAGDYHEAKLLPNVAGFDNCLVN